jgi:hypothetical protein
MGWTNSHLHEFEIEDRPQSGDGQRRVSRPPGGHNRGACAIAVGTFRTRAWSSGDGGPFEVACARHGGGDALDRSSGVECWRGSGTNLSSRSPWGTRRRGLHERAMAWTLAAERRASSGRATAFLTTTRCAFSPASHGAESTRATSRRPRCRTAAACGRSAPPVCRGCTLPIRLLPTCVDIATSGSGTGAQAPAMYRI